MEVPAPLLAAFPPSPTLLFELARWQTDDAMLTVIARADYGLGANEVMAELRPIRDEGGLPTAMSGQLGEVLELIRFSEPDTPTPPPFEPGPTGRRGHQSRLFACSVLLMVEAEWSIEEVGISTDSTWAQCLVSAKVLGEETSEAAARLLTWWIMAGREWRSAELLLFAVGLVVLATRLRAGRFSEPTLGALAEWALAQESVADPEFPPSPVEPRPLPFSLQAGFWRPLAAELKDQAKAIQDEDVRANLQLCAVLLDPYSIE
jgi:hypothetical protein